ncbi:MAG: hypothetical protein CMF41_06225 [Legionellales bacterium]|nr:hypothetical protein [Legionellales bacterium]OUX64180.1 MAG: hypothetical protein CBE41_03770 [Gammaproteobacteria bacterium TMED281]|tara:strand:+ start:1778 stop:2533 length:756 start_codon:yes stop_codon:yes gene_type:complete
MVTLLSLVFSSMFIFWVISQCVKNPGIVDIYWPFAFVLIAFYFWTINPNPSIYNLLAKLCILSWGFRLFTFLLITRVLPYHVEKRYDKLLKSKYYSFPIQMLFQFLTQVCLILIIATPIYFITSQPITELTILFIVGISLSIIGIIGETITDFQLFWYRENDVEHVCKVGLWRYSRHPNYFFDCLVWFGFSLIAMNVEYGYIALVSPLMLLYIMLVITIPVTESYSLAKRPKEYLRYQKETSKIVPWFRSH